MHVEECVMRFRSPHKLLCALIIVVSGLYAQQISEKDINREAVAEGLISVLERLNKQAKNPELAAYHRRPEDFSRMGSEVERSLSNANTIFKAKIDYSPLFLLTVDYNREAFQEYANSLGKRIVTLDVFNGVISASTDLAIKANLILKTNTYLVETKVNTVDDAGQDVPGCYVWYTPFLRDDDQYKRKFDKLSTPTTDFVPAGKWNIWSEKAGRFGPKTPYLCGDDGRTSREVDVPAPK